ncbi:MAG: flippase [Candidatus Moraniibacteriota bacterium]
MSTQRHSFSSSLLWLTAAEVIFTLSGYIIQSVAGRVLGPTDYGRYSLVITLTTVIIVLVGNGIPTAMSRYLSESFETNPHRTKRIKLQGIRLQSILIGTLTIAFFLLAPVIASLLGDPTLTPLFRFSSLILPAFAAASFYFSYFTGLHLFRHQAALKIFRSFARLLIIISLIVFFGIEGAIAGYILAPLATFCLGLWLDYHYTVALDQRIAAETQANTITSENDFRWQQLLDYAWPITLFMLFYEFFVSIDLYLVKAILHDDYATGLYNSALTLGRIPFYLFYALSIILLPALAKMKSEQNHEKMNALLTQSLRYAGIILLPVFIFLSAYAAPSLAFVFGTRYSEPSSILSLQTLAFGLSFLTVFYLLATALIGVGRARTAMWLTIIGLIVNTWLNWVFIHAFTNIVGAAIATSVSAFLVTGITLYIVYHIIPFSLNFPAIFKTALIGGILWYITSLAHFSSWLFIPASLALGILYLMTLSFFGVITTTDREPFLKLFHKKPSL